jgi:AcrR family transcriptional regulator
VRLPIGPAGIDNDSVVERLLLSATTLFARVGFDATSVQDIVDGAGVTKGGLYHYFASKDELLYAIHQRFISAGLARIEDVVALGLPPQDRLQGLVVALVESIASYLDGVTVFFRERHRLSPEQLKLARVQRDAFVKHFRDAIAEGQRTGVFRDDIPVNVATLGVFGAANWTYTWYRPRGPLTASEIGRHIATFVDGGLAKPKSVI